MTMFRRVTVPLIAPSLLAGAVLCWARALGEFGATITFAGNFPGKTQTMPLAVYLALETDPEAAIALALVLLAVSIAVLVGLRDRWLGAGGASVTPRREPRRFADAPRRRADSTAACAAGASSCGSLRGAPGEVLGVLGPNGAGKTRLLRALAGLTPMSRGHGRRRRCTTARRDVRARRAAPGRRGVPELPAVPAPDVRDNVAFAPRSGAAAGQRRGQCAAVAGAARARGAGRPPPARALRRAGPAGGPGPGTGRRAGAAAARRAAGRAGCRTRLDVRAELRAHLADFAGPTVLVTHDPLEAMVLADRLVVIEAGRVVQEGTPAEVARRPATQYVARLVGPEPVRRHASAPGASVDLDGGGHVAVATEAPAGAGARRAATRAITVHTERPEQISTRNIWPGTVAGLEMLADRVRLAGRRAPRGAGGHHAGRGRRAGPRRRRATVWLAAKATEIEAYAEPGRGAWTTDLSRAPIGPPL